MTPRLEASLRHHFQEMADGTVPEGQIDRVSAAVHARRQAPAWFARFRSPVPAVADLSDRDGLLSSRAVWLAQAAALVLVTTGAVWTILVMVGGSVSPPPRPTPTAPAPSPVSSATPSPTDACRVVPAGAIGAGCIEVAQDWTFSLGDHSARIGPDNDMALDAVGGELYLSRPPTWSRPALSMAPSPEGGRTGCLQALEGTKVEQPEIELLTLTPDSVICALAGDGRLFELHVVDIRPPGASATTTRVAEFAWIDWGPAR